MSKYLVITSSPHFLSGVSTRTIMRDVLIALAPAFVASIYFFGPRAAALCAVCIVSCVFFEWVYRKALGLTNTIRDLSAAVTGLILAYNLPSSLPFWMAVVGSFVSIVVVKQMFGGIGKNFANPAIVGRIVLMLGFTAPMTTWPEATDATTTATPLSHVVDVLPTYSQLFFGQIGGSLGETCAAALLLGFLYLVFRGIITLTTPVSYLGTVAVLAALLGGDPLYHLLAGGAILGAVFCATDYVTSPTTEPGKLIYGIGCGLFTVIIRFYGSLPEGASFSILLMNILTPYIDRFTSSKAFGGVYKK